MEPRGIEHMTAPYKRILVKLSGEALLGTTDFGIDPVVLKRIASEVLEIQRTGVQVACVIGGGNIFRGAGLATAGMDRVTADHMGMLATVMNALAMQDAIESLGGTRACRARSASTRCARTTFAVARCATSKRAASSSSRPAPAIPIFTTDSGRGAARHRDRRRRAAQGHQGQRHLRFGSDEESGREALRHAHLRQGARTTGSTSWTPRPS